METTKTYLVTLPYDDLKGMEKRCELLEEIRNDLSVLLQDIPVDSIMYKDIRKLIEKIVKSEN